MFLNRPCRLCLRVDRSTDRSQRTPRPWAAVAELRDERTRSQEFIEGVLESQGARAIAGFAICSSDQEREMTMLKDVVASDKCILGTAQRTLAVDQATLVEHMQQPVRCSVDPLPMQSLSTDDLT